MLSLFGKLCTVEAGGGLASSSCVGQRTHLWI